MAFPSNNFKGQEPGSNADIKKFCEDNYKITFPLFSKINVKGENIHPLYKHLTTQKNFEGDVKWNFSKILINKKGEVIARFATKTKPDAEEVTDKIKQALTTK